MKSRPREIVFLDQGGVREWLDAMEDRDERAYDAIVARLERIEEGNFGDCAPVGGGVSELRFLMTGPGYRLYFGEDGDVVVLLRAGTKKGQTRDIRIARKLWSEYKSE